ncbi:MAG: DUF2800 domain-containing protein [Firmicutes bacterium]|nr:DUF2800 domain-containing protein [Bacillota bacterium]
MSRAHALLSASSAHRWMACPPSAKLEAKLPDTTSEAAAEGTLAHKVCELKLQNYFDTTNMSKRKMNARIKKLKEDPLWQEEIIGHADTYLDCIKGLAISFDSAPSVLIEEKVDFSKWVHGGFGTADCLMFHGDTLHVIDFKYGKGVPVSAEKNPQLMLYALGAAQEYSMIYSMDRIHLVIVQPRISAEVSEWTITLDELLQFGETAREKAMLALSGSGEFNPGEAQCRFCRARATCRARADKNVKLAFATEKKPDQLTPEEIGEYLQQGEDVARWLSDLKEYALKESLLGHEITGYKAVEGRGSRAWTDMDKAFDILIESGTPEEMLYERKPLTLAQVEKLVGKKDFAAAVGDLVEKKPGKPTLVPKSDKREAITNIVSAEEAFGDTEN